MKLYTTSSQTSRLPGHSYRWRICMRSDHLHSKSCLKNSLVLRAFQFVPNYKKYVKYRVWALECVLSVYASHGIQEQRGQCRATCCKHYIRRFFFSGVECTCAFIPYVFNWKFSKASDTASTCKSINCWACNFANNIKQSGLLNNPRAHIPVRAFLSTLSQSCPDKMLEASDLCDLQVLGTSRHFHNPESSQVNQLLGRNDRSEKVTTIR